MDFKRLNILFVVIISLFLNPTYANTLNKQNGRKLLSNYGLTYCIYKYGQGEWLKKDAGASVGVYLQSGSHSSEAYSQLEKYVINRMYKEQNITDSLGNLVIIHKCLKISQSKSYQKFLRSLDKYM